MCIVAKKNSNVMYCFSIMFAMNIVLINLSKILETIEMNKLI